MSKKDITQKNYFDDNVRFADFMNAVCFHGRQVIKPEELEAAPTAVLKADCLTIMERLCDVVRKQTKDGAVYAIYVMENQEIVDYRMPVRVMLEESLAYDKQVKEIEKKNKTERQPAEESIGTGETEKLANGEFLTNFRKADRLIPIYTTVIYWGDKEWDGATSLRELIDFPEMDEPLKEELLELVPDYKIRVYDLNKEKDFTAFQTNLKTVFEFYSHKNEKKELRDYMNTHKNEVENLDDESKFFLSAMVGQKKLGNELLKQNTEKTEGRSMCKAIDDMLADSYAEGRAEAEAKAAQTIASLKKELEETREKSNCKAIDDMLADSYAEGRAEARAEAEAKAAQTIANLKREVEELRKQMVMQAK